MTKQEYTHIPHAAKTRGHLEGAGRIDDWLRDTFTPTNGNHGRKRVRIQHSRLDHELLLIRREPDGFKTPEASPEPTRILRIIAPFTPDLQEKL